MLRAVLDNLDGLDPSLHEHYAKNEKDGKFYLELEDDIRAHPKGAALKVALDRIKEEKTTLTTKLADVEAKLAELPADFDAEKFATDMDELAKLRKGKKKSGEGEDDDDDDKQQVKRLYEQRITNIEAKHATEREKLEKEKTDLLAEIERLVGDEGLTKALVAAGVDKKFLPGATALLRRSVKVKRDDHGFRAIVETDIGESAVEEFVSNWAQSDEGGVYMAKPNGGGAPGGDGGRLGENPFDQKAPNMTRQQAIIASNPDRAKQLAQAAGVKPYW